MPLVVSAGTDWNCWIQKIGWPGLPVRVFGDAEERCWALALSGIGAMAWRYGRRVSAMWLTVI
jgi:hypothetical protein